MSENCEHKYAHLRTTDRGYYLNLDSRYVLIKRSDTFFCEKCLHEVEKVKEYSGILSNRPDWAKDIKISI